LLEGYAASQAAKRLTAADFMHLDGLVKEMLVAADAGDFLRILNCDFQFHEYVMHVAGHGLLEEVWRATDAKIRVYLSATNLMYANLKSTAQSHARVFEGLRSGDPERARKAMEAHTEAALEQLVTRVLATTKK
jgi:DNA-binding GntR family transcriptional regulator